MYRVISLFLGILSILLSVYFLGMQISYMLLNKTIGYTMDIKYLFINGENIYFYFLTLIAVYFILDFVYVLFFSKKDRDKRRIARRLTRDEKIQFNHLASSWEFKKGLQRISFDINGEKNNIEHHSLFLKITVHIVFEILPIIIIYYHFYFLYQSVKNKTFIYDGTMIKNILFIMIVGLIFIIIKTTYIEDSIIPRTHLADLLDASFDFEKRNYNEILSFLNNNSIHKFNISDVHKFNTLKTYKIGDELTNRRGGIPIATFKNKMYIDPTDSHTLIIGTTNSGKTWGIIHPMIENLRMAGENMLINDLKGELYATHAHQLRKSGYKVLVLNFIEPTKSIQWNPLGLVIKKYRAAQRKVNEEILAHENFIMIQNAIFEKREELIKLEEKMEILYKHLIENKNKEIVKRIERVMKEKETIKEAISILNSNLPKADFSEAFELLKDIALTLCYDANAKEPFWNSQAGILLEGLVAFLLEETTEDENGNQVPLPDEMITLKSIKILLNQGMVNIGGIQPGKEKYLLQKYLDDFRLPTDHSVLKLSEYIKTAQNTRGSISSVFADKIDLAILNDNVVNMTSRNEFDFAELNHKKLAVFLIVHDEKKTYYPMVTIFIKQFYEEIIKIARDEEGLRLKYPCNIIYDEFGISPALKDVDSILAAGRSRGVRMNMVIQDTAQLDKNYGKEVAKSIKNNVMNIVYLLGNDPDTLEEISKRVGNKLVWNKEVKKYETVRVISTERLGKLSLGEALILRQRRNPFITRYYPYNRFNFYKNNFMNEKLETRELPTTPFFDINKAYTNRMNKKWKSKKYYEKNNKEVSKNKINEEKITKPTLRKD